MLRDDNPGLNAPNCWALIGGGAEKDETPEQTLKREIKEEISIEPKDIKFLFKRQDKEVYVYLVKLTADEAKNIKLGEEGQKVEFFDIEEVEPLLKTHGFTANWSTYKEYLKQAFKD